MNQVLLRPDYQVPLVSEVRRRLAAAPRKRVILQAPPGAGKTVMAAFMVSGAVSRGELCYFNVHRGELAQQTSLTWAKYGIRHGFIASGVQPTPSALAHVCMIGTLRNRLQVIPPPKLCVWDETHHIGATTWAEIMDAWPDTYHVGLTGTPWRLDGAGLGEWYDDMVLGPPVAWLIEHGHLSPYEIFAPTSPNMKGAKRVGGDYSRRDASERMEIPKRVGDIVSSWRKFAEGLRTVCYAVNKADSRMIVARFNGAGIPAAHLDSDTPKEERRKIIRQYAANELMILSNVDLFSEGFDLSAVAQTDATIDCVIQARPTQSVTLCEQQRMRCMRPAPGKTAIILDHAGNSSNPALGFPDDEREWTLEGAPRGRKGANDNGPPPPYTCVCARQIRRPLPAKCPHCDRDLIEKVKPVAEGEGELIRVTPEQKRAARLAAKREENEAVTLPELIELARRRGYKFPQQWAMKKWTASAWRKDVARKAEAERRAAMTQEERDREDFEVEFGPGSSCECWRGMPPCGWCTHPGNPHNQ